MRYCNGIHAEQVARWYLQKLDYVILNSRYLCQYGEIDIIARQGQSIVFIEVKSRLKQADEYLSKAQAKRIAKTASFYMQEHNLQMNMRFDLIVILQDQVKEHIENAFYGEEIF